MCQCSFKRRDIFTRRLYLDWTGAQCAEFRRRRRPTRPCGRVQFSYFSSPARLLPKPWGFKLHWFSYLKTYLNAHETNMPGFSLRQAPMAPPPPDVAQNIVGPPSQANMPRIFTYVTLPPMILFLMLRMYARLFVTRKVWVDDCELSETSPVNDRPLTCFPRPLPARLS